MTEICSMSARSWTFSLLLSHVALAGYLWKTEWLKIIFQSSRLINRWFKDRFPFQGWIPRVLVQLCLGRGRWTVFLCRWNPSCALSRAAVDPSWHVSAGTRQASCHWQNGTPQLRNSDKLKLKQGRLRSRVFSAAPQPLLAFQGDAVFTGCCSALSSSSSLFWCACACSELDTRAAFEWAGPDPAWSVLMCFTFQQRKPRHVPTLTSAQSWKHSLESYTSDCSDVMWRNRI